MIRIAAVSDLHGHLPTIPECDLLILAGDYPANPNNPWPSRAFRDWLAGVPAKRVVACGGNHDFELERSLAPLNLAWDYLQDSGTEFGGLKIWGTPWTIPFRNWAFMADDEKRRASLALIPDDTDILVTHGPAYGILGQTAPGQVSLGCKIMSGTIRRIKPRLHVHGHIHGGRGEEQFGQTLCANVAYLDEDYEPWNLPIWTCEL